MAFIRKELFKLDEYLSSRACLSEFGYVFCGWISVFRKRDVLGRIGGCTGTETSSKFRALMCSYMERFARSRRLHFVHFCCCYVFCRFISIPQVLHQLLFLKYAQVRTCGEYGACHRRQRRV